MEHNRPAVKTLRVHQNKSLQGRIALRYPFLAGGGTISLAIVFSSSDGFERLVATILGFGVIIVMTYLSFLSGDAIEKIIGISGLNALTRIMGLILVTVGVQILLGGIDSLLNRNYSG